MADTTTIYSWPYQEAGDPPDGPALGQELAEAIETTVDGIDDRLDTAESSLTALTTTVDNNDNDAVAALSSSASTPLVSAANTDTLVALKSFAFKDEYAYRIQYYFRIQMNGGTSPYAVNAKVKRLNASGTLIHDAGSVAVIGSNFVAITGWCLVKCTAGNTTQTIAVTAAYATTGSATSMDLEASTSGRTCLTIERMGPQADFSDCMEVPTA